VHVSAVPAPSTASYSAYPSFTPAAASPATTIPMVSSTAYTPTVTSPVAPNSVPAISSPGQAPHANSPGYQYNQHSYSVLPTPPAPAYHQQQQPPQYHQQPAMNAYSPPPTPQMNNFPGAVIGQPAAGPPAGYNVYPGAAPTGANPAVAGAPARPPKPLTSQEMDAKVRNHFLLTLCCLLMLFSWFVDLACHGNGIPERQCCICIGSCKLE
jgi:hypothetical protein